MPRLIASATLLCLIYFVSAHAFSINNIFARPPAPKGTATTLNKKKPEMRSLPPPPPPVDPVQDRQMPDFMPDFEDFNPISPTLWNSMTSAVLSAATKLAPKQYKEPSTRAARIQVNSLPPDSFRVDLTDIPVVGKALSGTYAKVKNVKREPAIEIASPKDKLGAIQTAADSGNLQFGLTGLFSSFLDIQLEPNQAGRAPVELKSPLIPKWPFAGRKSDWNKVSNLGNGETYYYNSATGETRVDEPKNI